MGGQVQATFPEECDRPAGREEQREKTAQVRPHFIHLHHEQCIYII